MKVPSNSDSQRLFAPATKRVEMYVPKPFRQHDSEKIVAMIEATPFATLITVAGGAPLVSHLPLLLDRSIGEQGALIGHLALANPQARALANGQDAYAIFLGPNAYVTPSWYESKREHGNVVPTWDYIAVHVRGTMRVVDDPVDLHALVARLTDHHEASRSEPWEIGDAPAEYIAGQLRAIVGFHLAITQIDGKWKLGQGKADADLAGVADGLACEANSDAVAIAEAIREVSKSR